MKNGTLKYRVGIIEKDISVLKEDMKTIRTNELPHMSTKIEKIATDVNWLKKWMWVVATASIGGMVAGIINLILNG